MGRGYAPSYTQPTTGDTSLRIVHPTLLDLATPSSVICFMIVVGLYVIQNANTRSWIAGMREVEE